MTRRLDPPLHKHVRLELAQLAVNMHCVTLESRPWIWLKRSVPPLRCHRVTLFLVPSMIRSAAPTVQLG
jgi:hypothetical protein